MTSRGGEAFPPLGAIERLGRVHAVAVRVAVHFVGHVPVVFRRDSQLVDVERPTHLGGLLVAFVRFSLALLGHSIECLRRGEEGAGFRQLDDTFSARRRRP